MPHSRADRPSVHPMNRRAFLRGAAGGVAAVAGLEGILAARRAPAFGQPVEIRLLQWVDFIPEGDVELRRQLAEYSEQNKMKVTLETINANDLQARITAAIQSGSGPDIIMMLHNWPQLYAGGLADVSDLCEWKAKDQGGFYAHSEAAARSGKRWLALPYSTGGSLIAYRRSWFAEVGAAQPPRTLEEYRKIGTALKKKGKPVGQTLGHTFGDAPTWTYPLVWTFGGAETDPTGKKVVINSKGTVEAVKWMVSFWKEACDEGALAWDDTNNNRAFHANEISATLNGASIYIFAKRNPDKVKDEKGEPMWTDIAHFGIPDGPNGPTAPYFVPFSHGLMKYSKNQKAAKDFLRWLHSKEQFGKWFAVETGYSVGATTSWENHPMWATVDEPLKAFRVAARGSRMIGWAGPSNAKATEVYTKYIITDIFAKAVQGMSPEDAVKWGEAELKKVYET
ncbi:MAG TPA: extracellular solute-binding protein [Candidatus Bathyarchaeia archaeon]|nr:extracellular solute-binding protein [Candidatus Bathyarchaeia archaeon]